MANKRTVRPREHQLTYAFCGLRLTIEHEEPDELIRIATVWEDLFAVDGEPEHPSADPSPFDCAASPSRQSATDRGQGAGAPNSATIGDDRGCCAAKSDRVASPAVRFRFMPREALPPEAPSAQLVSSSPDLRILRTQQGFRLAAAGAVLDLDVSHGVGCGCLENTFWRQPREGQRRFLILGFVMLAHGCDRFALHANAVAQGRSGCLIVGGSGCGKTTLSLGLIRRGWDHLGDDVVLLRRRDPGIEACAVSRGFSCTANTAARFPELLPSAARCLEKSMLYVDGIYRSRQLASCRPATVLLPVIVNRPTSELVPLDSAAAVSALIQYSAGIMVDRAGAARQLDVLRDLVGHVKTFRFLAGRDVLDAPDRMEELLTQSAVAT